MARTIHATLASISAGFLLALSPGLLFAKSDTLRVGHIRAQLSGKDTTSCQTILIFIDDKLALESAEGNLPGKLADRCFVKFMQQLVSISALNRVRVGLTGDANLSVKANIRHSSRQGEVLHPPTPSQQKPANTGVRAPRIHQKKGDVAPDQPWETDFLVWNESQSANWPGRSLVE